MFFKPISSFGLSPWNREVMMLKWTFLKVVSVSSMTASPDSAPYHIQKSKKFKLSVIDELKNRELLPEKATYLYKPYRISSIKRRGAYLIFLIQGAALIRGRRLFRNSKISLLKCFHNSTNFVEIVDFSFWDGSISFYILPSRCNKTDLWNYLSFESDIRVMT